MNSIQCFHRILSFHQPGGESSRASNLSPTGKVILRLNRGESYGYVGYLEGEVIGVDLDSHAVFSTDCFTPGCFEGGGIWTTAITTNRSRELEGITQYWVGGTVDAEGALWFVDLGTICPATGDFALKDRYLPISVNGHFESRVELPAGLKVAVLKRVTSDSVETVAHYFGTYLVPDRLSRVKPGVALNYTAEDQQTDIEEIALSLSTLMLSGYRHVKAGRTVFYLKGQPDVDLTQVIEENLSRLSRLVDTISITRRYGSIPRFVATYSEPDQLYGPLADCHYNNRIVRLFEEGCFKEGCFQVTPNKTLVSREVHTRALAWLAYALCLYTYYWKSDKYVFLLETLGVYLLNQINHRFGLPSYGWTHHNTLEQSEEIEEYSFSTAVAVCLACLKIYDLREDVRYLEAAADIHEGIFEQLYASKTKTFLHSLSDQTESGETLIYGLLLTLSLKRADLSELRLSAVQQQLRQNYGKRREVYLRDNAGNLVSDGAGDYQFEVIEPLSLQGIQDYPDELSLLQGHQGTLREHTNANFWIINLLQQAQFNQFEVEADLDPLAATLHTSLSELEPITTLLTTSHCLDGANYIARVLSDFPIKEFEQLLFQRNFAFDKLRYLWPTEYSWASPQALTIHGNLGKLLKVFARSLSTAFSLISRTKDSTFSTKARSTALDQIAKDYGYTRLQQETSIELRSRLTEYLQTQEKANTAEGIRSKLREIGVNCSINEPWQRIQISNTFHKIGHAVELGEGYYSGNDYATASLIEIEVNQPLISEIQKIIQQTRAAGIKVIYRENLEFEEEFSLGDSSCLNWKQYGIDSCYILQEDNGFILTEEGDMLTSCVEMTDETNPT